MEKQRPQTRARVRVTIEVETGAVWGDDRPLSQIWDQATRSVIEQIHSKFGVTYKIIGEPVVTALMVPRV